MRVIFAEGSEALPSSVAEVEEILSSIESSSKPLILTIECGSAELAVGLSSAGCFVQLAAASGEPPYFVTVGDPAAAGVVPFLFHGAHHTEVSRRHLISHAQARLVVTEFVASGSRSPQILWEEV
jgi:hypothetical protein